MITHFDIVINTIFEPLVTACDKLGQNCVTDKVASDIVQITVSFVLY